MARESKHSGTARDLDPAEISKTLDEIDRIGNRYHGTPGEARCRDYLCERFEQIGLKRVRLEPFRYLACEPRLATCRLLSPERRELLCRPLQFCADAENEGEAIYVGAGRPEDFQRLDRLGIDLTGRILVAHTRYPFYVAPLLHDRGIGGLIIVSHAPDGLIANSTAALYPPPLEPPWRGRPVPYPGVTVEAAAGRELISTMTAGRPVMLRIEHRARYIEKQASNVVGEVPGRTAEQVIVGAHYDTQAEGPGVWDNGAGVASLLEIARNHVTSDPRRTVVAVAFAVEEVGTWGSTAYTVAHADEMARAVGMVNLDAVASRFPGRLTIYADEVMRPYAIETVRQQGSEPQIVLDARVYSSSDHAPFCAAGVPSCFILESPLAHPYYHTSGDIRALVDEVKVAETAGISHAVVSGLAHGESRLNPLRKQR